jgi:hypothetical protein
MEVPSHRSGRKAVSSLSKGEALILMLLLSFGLSAVIWASVAVLVGGER